MKMTDKETAEVNRRVDEIQQRALAHHRDWEPLYEDGRRFLWNDQKSARPGSADAEAPEDNLIFPAVMQELALLAQQRGMLVTQPWEDGDAAGAAVWRDLLDWQYTKGLEMPLRRLEAALDGKEAGHWIWKVWWDDRAEWNEEDQVYDGRLRLDLVPTGYVVIDPDSPSVKRAESIVEMRSMTVAEAVATWPEYEDEIEAAKGQEAADFGYGAGGFHVSAMGTAPTMDGSNVSGERGAAPPDSVTGRLAALLSGRLQRTEDNVDEPARPPDMVLVTDVFFRDYEMEDAVEVERPTLDELLAAGSVVQSADGLQNVFADTREPVTEETMPVKRRPYKRPRWPYGRRILRVGAKTILNPDTDQQRWKLKRWPYVSGVNAILPHTWHGLNATEMVRGLQEAVNDCTASLVNWLRQFGDPWVKVEEGALADDPNTTDPAKHLRPRPGQIVKVAKGQMAGVVREGPPAMPAAAFQVFELLSQAARDQTGMQNIGLGRTTPGGTTATEAIRMETNTKLGTALQSFLLDHATIQALELAQLTLREHMKPGQKVRILGQDQQAGMAAIDADALNAQFDLRLEISTTLPYARDRKKLEAKELFDVLGMPYLRRLLEAYEVDNIDDILAGVQAWMLLQETMAQAQQAEEAAAAGGGQGGQGGPAAPPAGVVSAHPANAGGPDQRPGQGEPSPRIAAAAAAGQNMH